MIKRVTEEAFLRRGQLLWYKHKKTKEVLSVTVTSVFTDSFAFFYNNRCYRFPITAIGVRLFRYPDEAFGVGVSHWCTICGNSGTVICNPYGVKCGAFLESDRPLGVNEGISDRTDEYPPPQDPPPPDETFQGAIKRSCDSCFLRASGECPQLKNEPCDDYRVFIPATAAEKERRPKCGRAVSNLDKDAFNRQIDHGKLC